MRLNLFKFKKELRARRDEPRRRTTIFLYQADFDDMLLLLEEDPDLAIGQIVREAVRYGLQHDPDISSEIKKIKDKIEAQRLKEAQRKEKLNSYLAKGY